MMLCSMWIAAISTQGIVALVAGSLAIVGFIVDRLIVPASRRLRRRREPKRLARTLADLRCGVQLQRFTDLLGQPPTRSLGSSHMYALDDVFVDVDTDDYSNVSRFAITVRTSKFKPRLAMGPGGDVVLGESTYAALGLDGVAQGLYVMRSGAGRHTMYAESYYFGNPGNYQCWVVASNPASELAAGNLDGVLSALGGGAAHGAFQAGAAAFGGEMPKCWYTRPPIRAFRERTPINTLSVSGAYGVPDAEPGPRIDEVRVFAPHRVMDEKRPELIRGFIGTALVVAIVATLFWIGWPVEL